MTIEDHEIIRTICSVVVAASGIAAAFFSLFRHPRLIQENSVNHYRWLVVLMVHISTLSVMFALIILGHTDKVYFYFPFGFMYLVSGGFIIATGTGFIREEP